MNARPKINPKLDEVHDWASDFLTSCGIFVLAILTSVVKYPWFATLAHRLSLRTLYLGLCPPGFLFLCVEAEAPMNGATIYLNKLLSRVETDGTNDCIYTALALDGVIKTKWFQEIYRTEI